MTAAITYQKFECVEVCLGNTKSTGLSPLNFTLFERVKLETIASQTQPSMKPLFIHAIVAAVTIIAFRVFNKVFSSPSNGVQLGFRILKNVNLHLNLIDLVCMVSVGVHTYFFIKKKFIKPEIRALVQLCKEHLPSGNHTLFKISNDITEYLFEKNSNGKLTVTAFNEHQFVYNHLIKKNITTNNYTKLDEILFKKSMND